MGAVGQVTEIWRYPVSSLAGEALSEASVAATGLLGDRRWGAVDAAGGTIARPGKEPRWDGTPAVAARVAGDGVEIRVADGPWLPGAGAPARAALARHFGFAVELRPHPAPGEAAAGATVAPRYALRHVHLLSLQSMAAIRRALPQSRIGAARFRPNFLVDLPGQPGEFPESRWPMGQEIAVGAARLKVVDPCKRCVFVTLRHGDLPRDAAVLRAIAERNDGNLGVVCAVVSTGAVRHGDAVRLE